MSTPPPDGPVRLLIVDDSPLIRLGLRSALEDRPEVVIVGEAGTAAQGIALATELQPDVVLLDLRLPDRTGFEACREICQHCPAARVLILTSSTDERNVQQAISAGAYGYLLKDNDGSMLARAVLQVASGRSVLDPSLTNQVMNLMKHNPDAPAVERLRQLSPRERHVVELISKGLTNKEIGEQLGLTEKTVKNYLATVFDKLGISRRAQAATLYVTARQEDPSL